jgi:hypothetical protein
MVSTLALRHNRMERHTNMTCTDSVHFSFYEGRQICARNIGHYFLTESKSAANTADDDA